MNNDSDNWIVWYGERGAVNKMVFDWGAKDTDGREKAIRRFVEGITWSSGDAPPKKLEGFRLFLEPSFAQFGDPDLILVAHHKPEELHVFFVEAKAGSYQDSAMSNDKGMVPGFNSSINGQLSLRYRFVRALERRNQGENRMGEIVELADDCEFFRGRLNDKRIPRKLKKEKVVGLINDLMPGIARERCYFVALCGDGGPPAEAEDLLPVWGEESSVVPNFGWCRFPKDMASTLQTAEADFQGAKGFKTVRLNEEDRDDLADILKNAGFKPNRERLVGSIDGQWRGLRAVKLARAKSTAEGAWDLLLDVECFGNTREDLPLLPIHSEPEPYLIQSRPFWRVQVEHDALETVLTSLRKCLETDDVPVEELEDE